MKYKLLFISSLILLLFFGYCRNINKILLSPEPIKKAVLEISRDTGLQRIEYVNKEKLIEIDSALKNMVDTNVQRGGGVEIWAKLTIYKQAGKAEILITNSTYYGWYLETDNGRTLYSKYLIDLLKSYK